MCFTAVCRMAATSRVEDVVLPDPILSNHHDEEHHCYRRTRSQVRLCVTNLCTPTCATLPRLTRRTHPQYNPHSA